MDIDPLSLTWIALTKQLNDDHQIYLEQLAAPELSERKSDFLRGQLEYITFLQSFGDNTEVDQPHRG